MLKGGWFKNEITILPPGPDFSAIRVVHLVIQIGVEPGIAVTNSNDELGFRELCRKVLRKKGKNVGRFAF